MEIFVSLYSLKLSVPYVLIALIACAIVLREGFLRNQRKDASTTYSNKIYDLEQKTSDAMKKLRSENMDLTQIKISLKNQLLTLTEENHQLNTRINYLTETLKLNDEFFEAGSKVEKALRDAKFKPKLIIKRSPKEST